MPRWRRKGQRPPKPSGAAPAYHADQAEVAGRRDGVSPQPSRGKVRHLTPFPSVRQAGQPASVRRLARAIARQAAPRTYLQGAPTSMVPAERAWIRLVRVAIAAGRGWLDASLDDDLAPEGSRIGRCQASRGCPPVPSAARREGSEPNGCWGNSSKW